MTRVPISSRTGSSAEEQIDTAVLRLAELLGRQVARELIADAPAREEIADEPPTPNKT